MEALDGDAAAIALAQLEQAIIDAALQHVLPWQTVQRMLDQLPAEDGCRWCGGELERFGDGPRITAWCCRACHRINTEWARRAADDSRPNRDQAAGMGRRDRESWRRAAAQTESEVA